MSHTTRQGGSRRSMDAAGVRSDTGGAIRVSPADGAHLHAQAVIHRERLPVRQSGIPLGNGQTSFVPDARWTSTEMLNSASQFITIS
jgi:hypothetical protein